MYTLEEWSDTLAQSGRDLREFLVDNNIDDIGIPADFDWEFFYEALLEDNPFSAGTGAWVDIFKNWYRHDMPETYGISRISAGCTNADSDIDYFTSSALLRKEWRPEDFCLFLHGKIKNVAAKTNGKNTPSKRFLTSASKYMHLWKTDFIKSVDNETLINLCCGDAKHILGIELLKDICKSRFSDFKVEALNHAIERTRFSAMFDDYLLGGDAEAVKTFKAASGFKRFKAMLKATDIGYGFDETDALYVIELAKQAGPACMRFTTRHLFKSSIGGVMSANVFVDIITSLNSDEEIKSFPLINKKELLTKAIIEHYYPAIKNNEPIEAAVTRVFELYGFHKGILELFGDITHERVENAVNVHFGSIAPDLDCEHLIDFAPQSF